MQLTSFRMLIDGEMVGSAGKLHVTDPATGELFAEVPDCSKDLLDRAMLAAKHAFAQWAVDEQNRREVMRACARAVDEAAVELGTIQTREQGMPLGSSIARVRGAARVFERYANLDIPRVVIQDDEKAFIEAVRRPLGVVVAITAWNGPILQAVNNIAPAFWTGNTLVLKPSPFTPAATLRLGEVLAQVVPPGVLNVLSGADPLGQLAVEHPIPRGISFTGSVATGKKVNLAAANQLKRVLLELGGNDPVIVLDDVDPEEFAAKIFWAAFRNSGQVCQAPKRVYVPESLYARVVSALAKCAADVKIGNGLNEGVTMGPLSNESQFEKIGSLVSEAVSSGATVAAGGKPMPLPGFFFEPTILADLKEGVRVVDEEQFGPALPIMSYQSVDEAVARANDTDFGLGASVWSDDIDRARAVAERLQSGNVWINTHAEQSSDVPFGGVKGSGLGRRNGTWSLDAFTDIQTVWVSRNGSTTYIPRRSGLPLTGR